MPILAFTADHSDSVSRLEWAAKNSYALEFSPDPLRPDLLPGSVLPFLRRDIPVRFHTRYFGWEMGHADRHEADKALEVHLETLKRMQGLSEPVITVHTGLSPGIPVREKHIVDNLSRLVEYAARLGITVCLENLRLGHASDPHNIINWAKASGAGITMDLGHALGCSMVLDSEITPLEIADLFDSRIYGVHIYGREDERGHHPIMDLKPFHALINRLLQTGCGWWTVELNDPEDAAATRNMIEDYLDQAYIFSSRKRPGQEIGEPLRRAHGTKRGGSNPRQVSGPAQ